MQKDYKFQIEDALEIPDWADTYPEHKFTVYKCCFLSTKPNSHEIPITDSILRKSASSILGNFLTAKIEGMDASSHRKDESIMGYFPKEQSVEFVEEDGVTKAYAYAVVSRRYAEQFNNIFEFDNLRNSSVEMTVDYDDETDEVTGFDIFCLTVLGKRVAGSCPDANIKMVRFSQKKAEAYFSKNDTHNILEQFMQERKECMSEKSYKIDSSKESMSDSNWGDVDKTAMRDKIMQASNRSELVKSVYAVVEDGWEDAPSEKLKYPIMELKGDTFVYNRNALSSALAYAKQNNEEAVINKVEKLYKELDIEIDGKEEDAKMEEEIKLSESEAELEEPKAEEAEEKEVEKEEEAEMADESNPETEEEHNEDGEGEEKDDREELMSRIAQLEADVADRDNVIMGCNAELEELRKFKADIEEKEKAMSVENVMSEVKEFLDEKQFADMREQGMSCDKEGLDAWANGVKAVAFSAVKKQPKKAKDNLGVWGFAAPIAQNKNKGLWD